MFREESKKILKNQDGSDFPLVCLKQIKNVVIQSLEYPWMGEEDAKPTDLEYELFCGALESFCSKPLVELLDDWMISLETVLPAIRSSIRIYSKAACQEKIREMDTELVRWVEFGLSASENTSYVENSQMVKIGCKLVEQLSAMHDKNLSIKFSEPQYLRHIMNIISSKLYCSSIRCGAARALLKILSHPLISWKLMLTKLGSREYNLYEQIVDFFINPTGVSLDLLAVLRDIVSYFSFKHSTDIVVSCARKLCVDDTCTNDGEISQLISSFDILHDFFSKIRNDFGYTSCIAHQAVVKSRLIPHICAHIAAPTHSARTRFSAVRCLRMLCDLNNDDISGVLFLAYMDAETVTLVARMLNRVSEENEVSLLPFALRAIVLIDQLAAVNEKKVLKLFTSIVDVSARINILQNMLYMLYFHEGRLALISALSFRDNLKHLLFIFDVQKSMFLSAGYIDDELKMRFRQTTVYGYLCEILFSLARNQSSGTFWRKNGPKISKLIDCNLISAATSLKHWLEPFREELMLGTGMSTLNLLLIRLNDQGDKYIEGDPPLPLITLLRLIDSIFDEPEREAPFNLSYDEIRFDFHGRFYENGGFDRIRHVLSIANNQQSKRILERCTTFTGDSYIYCQFVRSAISVMYKLLTSLEIINWYPDKLTVDTLLRTYTLCCIDESCCDQRVKEIVLKSFALFICQTRNSQIRTKKSSRQPFLEFFLFCGFENPSYFLATLDILRQLLPLPSNLLANIAGMDMKKIMYVEKMWNANISKCSFQLEFAVTLGTASSQRLRQCLFDVCKRLAYLSEDNALLIAEILIKQSSKVLTSSACSMVIDGMKDDLSEEESDIRFGSAADSIMASFYAFLAVCSGEFILRDAIVAVISKRRNYISTLLKFFKLASRKTLPHVMFQTYVINFFQNICYFDNETDIKHNCLPRDMYIVVCQSLVEHFGNIHHNKETVLLALKSICIIGRSSELGRAVISNALISNESAVLRFINRFITMSEPDLELFSQVATHLAELFRDILKNDSVKSVVIKSQISASSEEHPLMRFNSLLVESECSQDVILTLDELLNVSIHDDFVDVVLEDLEAYEWPENLVSVQQVDSQQMTSHQLKNLLNL
ncbi:unnamed protein product [Thelazia callipaeda]|uniref:DUF2428 domain-containing protein n=1 Tax=Thelazia callipaeda TaxID=103827 RepID=A0A0N5CWG4_THECL|nr:unnamed protein product [Thelazia callipaeda]